MLLTRRTDHTQREVSIPASKSCFIPLRSKPISTMSLPAFVTPVVVSGINRFEPCLVALPLSTRATRSMVPQQSGNNRTSPTARLPRDPIFACKTPGRLSTPVLVVNRAGSRGLSTGEQIPLCVADICVALF